MDANEFLLNKGTICNKKGLFRFISKWSLYNKAKSMHKDNEQSLDSIMDIITLGKALLLLTNNKSTLMLDDTLISVGPEKIPTYINIRYDNISLDIEVFRDMTNFKYIKPDPYLSSTVESNFTSYSYSNINKYDLSPRHTDSEINSLLRKVYKQLLLELLKK